MATVIRELNGANTDFGILCDVNNPVEVRATELISGWLKDVGIGSHQNCLDIDSSVALIWPNFVAVPEPDYDMGIWGWSSDYAIPAWFRSLPDQLRLRRNRLGQPDRDLR